MTPILSTVIKSHHGTADAGRIRDYLDNVTKSLPALLPYRYTLLDVMALKTDSRVEIYEDREAGGGSICILWLPDARSAALKPCDTGEWQWTRASNPLDALRRYKDGRMEPEVP
jgi:hypothetical protein